MKIAIPGKMTTANFLLSLAYPDATNTDTWIAEVKNETNIDIVFTAIDKCILQDNDFLYQYSNGKY